MVGRKLHAKPSRFVLHSIGLKKPELMGIRVASVSKRSCQLILWGKPVLGAEAPNATKPFRCDIYTHPTVATFGYDDRTNPSYPLLRGFRRTADSRPVRGPHHFLSPATTRPFTQLRVPESERANASNSVARLPLR